ncbi:unnamed protein product [Caenorhabditis angaria]|uniref:Uncharacterized protein n=1 Tax=Caenorhabditis angaria TaxID=860376 RepID=A0A9P1J4D0_9PELO|nr:unnamed protein product [Caenorhabditis angaria]
MQFRGDADSHYKVLRFHEVWHWDDWAVGGFFAPIIKSLLKMKHETTDFPDYVKTVAEEDAFIEAIKKHENVILDKDSIKKNPPIRLIA